MGTNPTKMVGGGGGRPPTGGSRSRGVSESRRQSLEALRRRKNTAYVLEQKMTANYEKGLPKNQKISPQVQRYIRTEINELLNATEPDEQDLDRLQNFIGGSKPPTP